MNAQQDIPSEDLQHLQNLLQLKNYEKPVDGYFEDFLEEFHRRQREQVLVKRPGMVEKVASWFSGMGAAKWAYGAGLAYAVLFLAFIWAPSRDKKMNLANENAEILPGDRKLEHVDLEKQKLQDAIVPNEDDEKELLEMLPKDF